MNESSPTESSPTWHTLDCSRVLEQLETETAYGLSDEQVFRRRDKFGPNELLDLGSRGPLLILWEQFYNAMILLLIVAASVSFLLGELRDSVAILVIVVLNAALGFTQDYRAERALAALKKLSVPLVRVRRNGSTSEISSTELVPGDVILLEAGNSVPADCRLLDSASLKTQEAALTGESDSIEKQPTTLTDAKAPLGDRFNMLWMGTAVTYGRGCAVVTATGMDTELGRIAHSLQNVRPEATPLQKRLGQLGRSLAIAAIAIVAVVFVLGVGRGEEPKLMLMTALSLAVAVVPEGLPAVATVALAIGARQMFKRHALIRKLPAVETLGSVTVICSDKTGTLTQNQMTVTTLEVAGRRQELPRSETVNSQRTSEWSEIHRDHSLSMLLVSSCLCNDAQLVEASDNTNSSDVTGEPTETALVVAADQAGLRQPDLVELFPRIAETPFDSDRKRMTTFHRPSPRAKSDQSFGKSSLANAIAPLLVLDECDIVAFSKGAITSLLEICVDVWDGDDVRGLDEEWQGRIVAAGDELVSQGMRVLGSSASLKFF